MYDVLMRTTLNLPEDLHRVATSMARDRDQSLSQIVSELLRKALGPEVDGEQVAQDPATGLPAVHLGHPVTTEMVRAATDEE